MPTAIATSTDQIRDAQPQLVYLRQKWTDEWELEPHLFCNFLTFCANPTVSSAEFEWRYGEGMRQYDSRFDQVEYLNKNGWWVKVEIPILESEEDEQIVWVGLITEDGDNPHGASGGFATGVQKMLAYGAEILLHRKTIDTSWYLRSGSSKRCGRGITFNDESRLGQAGGLDKKEHFDRPGNRSSETDFSDVYVFIGDSDTENAEPWSTEDIVDYLLNKQPLNNASDENVIAIRVDDDSTIYLPSWDKPVVRQHGRTLRDVLDELLDRRRLLGYCLEYDDGSDGFKLRAFTYADVDVEVVTGDRVYMANQDQKSLDFDNAVDILDCHVRESETQQYDQVQAVGARIVCCGTLDDELTRQWTESQADDYNEGAYNETGYAALEWVDKVERDAVARSADSLRRVYSYFGLPKDWAGKVTDFEVKQQVDLLPSAYSGLDGADDSPWYYPDVRFLAELPLKTDHDYSSDKIATDKVVDNTPEGASWHYRPLLCMAKLPDNPSGGTRYTDVTKIAQAVDAESFGDGAGRNFSCSVRAQTDGPGIIVRVSGGVGQHELAGNDFYPNGVYDWPGTFDWRDNLIVTFAVEADVCVEAKWPAEIAGDPDAVKVLRIDASRQAGMHYVAPGTVVDLADGKPVYADGGLIRDDRPLLDQIARVAFEWYGRRRQALTLSYVGASNLFRVGDLITTIGSGQTEEPIRTVITEVRIDLARDLGETHRTTIQTQWAELDVLRLI